MSLVPVNSEFAELEDEIKKEFFSDVKDCVQDINECLALKDSDDTSSLVNRLFRSIHTVKGNCNMVFLAPYVEATHLIEEMVQDLRNGVFAYHPAFTQLFVSTINAVDELLTWTLANNTYDSEKLHNITQLIADVRCSEEQTKVKDALRAERAIQDGHFRLDLIAVSQIENVAFSILDATDMEFFNYLSESQQIIDPTHVQQMNVQIALARALNTDSPLPSDDDQLMAALHVYGFFKVVMKDNKESVNNRVFSSGGLLSRIPGWETAAELVYQSNEKLDGSGFPRGLCEAEIQPAAKIIKLVDMFITTCFAHSELGYKQSLFVGVKSINQQAGLEYPAWLIELFNQQIKTNFLHQAYW